jgi:hypothetical protein
LKKGRRGDRVEISDFSFFYGFFTSPLTETILTRQDTLIISNLLHLVNPFSTTPANPIRTHEVKTLHIARLASGLVWAIGRVLTCAGLAGESDALAVGLAAEITLGAHIASCCVLFWQSGHGPDSVSVA